jgi:hemerythrin superfamily protein
MPDVTTIIENDHRKVAQLFTAYAAAISDNQRDKALEEIRLALAPHSAAEELLVYPAVRRAATDGREQATHAINEHQEIKRLLSEVDKMSAGDARRDERVRDLQRVIEDHVAEEEGTLLPSLRQTMDAKRLEQMGELFQRIKPLLPTHPHPLVPGTATAQLLAGPLASVADRIRDFIER